MIPRILHYCWYGSLPKPELVINCMLSWKEKLPDYTLMEWNEHNSSFDCEFVKMAFLKKKWAFVSDYFRLKVLYEFGGIYLDTDMLVVKSLDEMLNNQCFLGYQSNGEVSGGIIGSIPNHRFIMACIREYQTLKFDEYRLLSMAIPIVLSKLYRDFDQAAALTDTITIYARDYFYPYPFEASLKNKAFRNYITSQTVTVHLWNASWFTFKEKAGFEYDNGKYFTAIIALLRYMLTTPGVFLKDPFFLFRPWYKKITRKL